MDRRSPLHWVRSPGCEEIGRPPLAGRRPEAQWGQLARKVAVSPARASSGSDARCWRSSPSAFTATAIQSADRSSGRRLVDAQRSPSRRQPLGSCSSASRHARVRSSTPPSMVRPASGVEAEALAWRPGASPGDRADGRSDRPGKVDTMSGSWRRCARRDRLPRGLRSASEWHVPADQLAAEIVRRPLARSATRAAPTGEAAFVGQEGEVACALGRIAVPAVTRAAAVDPVLAGAARRRRRRPQGAGRERARCPHLLSLPRHEIGRFRAGTAVAPIVRAQSNAGDPRVVGP